MFILAFETSCDDTSVALFENEKLLAMNTQSQIKDHNETGGVVPEVAARLHANNIFNVLEKTLKDGNVSLKYIDYIACTESPGLLPSLLVGLTVSKVLTELLEIPFISINHIEAHVFSNFLERKKGDLIFPGICLTVSGGHNDIYLWKDLFDMSLLGETLDDSAGECFDKVAKMMGLGYPGGPIISKIAGEYMGNFKGIFPKVLLNKDSLDFSFSGLKSAVKREVDRRKITNYELRITNGKEEEVDKIKNEELIIKNSKEDDLLIKNLPNEIVQNKTNIFLNLKNNLDHNLLTEIDIKEIAFEFENTVIEILKTKLFLAVDRYNVNSVFLAGGVSANSRLKNEVGIEAKKRNLNFYFPTKPIYSMDNAAMVGILAYYKIKHNIE